MIEEYQLDQLFERVIVSGSVQQTKRGNGKIFELAAENLDIASNEILFIENTEASLEIPKQMGWQTYYHNDKKNDVSALTDYFREQQLID